MPELLRPLLAAPTKEEQLRALKWPMLLSAKLDGVRALCRRNPETGKPELVSRKLKLIPNAHVQSLFAREEFVGLDGELCVGPENAKNLMQATTSGVMSADGVPDVAWFVFDKWDSEEGYAKRAKEARQAVTLAITVPQIKWLSQFTINSYQEMLVLENDFLERGFEGAMLRSPMGRYKQNRSTVRESILLKVKRFEDGEAEVIGYFEQMRNENEKTTDELGYAKRSTHAGGKVGAGVLGGIHVKDCATGIEFDIGTGWTLEQRTNLWKNAKYLVGKIAKYKHFAIGVKDKPRFPIFVGWRDRRDM